MTTAPPRLGPRFVILEDHTLVRQLLERRIRGVYRHAELTYQGSSVDEAKATMGNARPDAIILDLDLGNGVSAESNLNALLSLDIPILVVSASATPRLVQQAIAMGACGYVSKQCDITEFDRALIATVACEEYVSRDLAKQLAVPAYSHVVLSPQEARTLALYASGLKLEAVARQMGISRGTASEYIKRVRQKYASKGEALPSKVDLYQKARDEGLI